MEKLNYQEQFEAIQSIERLSPEIALGAKVVEILSEAGYEAYFAGGFARDLFLGEIPKDVDVATSSEFNEHYQDHPTSSHEGVLEYFSCQVQYFQILASRE